MGLFVFLTNIPIQSEGDRFYEGTPIEGIEEQAINGKFNLFGLLSEIYGNSFYVSDQSREYVPKAFAYLILYNHYHNGVLPIGERPEIQRHMTKEEYAKSREIRYKILSQHNAKALEKLDRRAFLLEQNEIITYIKKNLRLLNDLGKAMNKRAEIEKISVDIGARYGQALKKYDCDWRISGISDALCRYNYFLMQSFYNLKLFPQAVIDVFPNQYNRYKVARYQWIGRYAYDNLYAAEQILADLNLRPVDATE